MTTPRTPSRRLRPLRTGVLACLLAAGWVSAANASKSYPGQMMDYMNKQPEKGVPACPPTCLLCHYSPNGGDDTIRVEGFVEALKLAAGTVMLGGDNVSLDPALTALENNPCTYPTPSPTPCDSDLDGKSDMAEVRAGTSPDGLPDTGDCPKYGCGASSVAPGRVSARHLDGTLSMGALGLLALLVRRRRSTVA